MTGSENEGGENTLMCELPNKIARHLVHALTSRHSRAAAGHASLACGALESDGRNATRDSRRRRATPADGEPPRPGTRARRGGPFVRLCFSNLLPVAVAWSVGIPNSVRSASGSSGDRVTGSADAVE